MKKLTREWVRKAEADVAAARKLATSRPPISDPACFHCQQAAEKYFKALLQQAGLPVPRTHDLSYLLALLLPQEPLLASLGRAANALTQFAVTYRYPGSHANPRQARTALRYLERVRRELRLRLGLRSR